MKTIAKFIGINEYLDEEIPDLSYAKRDALALYTLFTDNIRDIKAELLVDENATIENIKKSIDDSFSKAEETDNVIVFFSGHGTHSHQITAHDTSLSAMDSTTISTEFLAQEFKKCKAQNIILLLDCCFSGATPAKVVESSPQPKMTGDPIQTLSGKGRVIITACNHTESSFENNKLCHGIFTHSVIETLLHATKPFDVFALYNSIKENVAEEIKKNGITQTPVFHGNIEGGMEIPNFKKGKHYLKFFPEPPTTVKKDFSNLALFGISDEIIKQWKHSFPNGFNELQLEAINKYNILRGDSLFVVAPTSSGKTFIGEVVAARCITQGKKSVFLLPYKALVNEKYEQFQELYGEKAGLRVIRCTGDYSDDTSAYVKGKYDFAFLTYEMFLNISLSTPTSLYNVGVVILDEAQFITEPTRGIIVELLLTNLLVIAEQNIKPQLIILSAVVGDTNSFEKWVNCNKMYSDYRPVPLTEGVIDRSGKYLFLNTEGKSEEIQLIPARTITQRRDKPSSQDIIVPLVSQLVKKNEKVLIFRNMKGSAQGCANYLAEGLGLNPVTEALELLPTHDPSKSSAVLRNSLNGGTAFHTANLSKEERIVIEGSYRDSNSNLRVLTATTTLAAGINTPASTVIIAETKFIGNPTRDFTIAEYKNISGRAGRLGFNEKGKSILIADNSVEARSLFNKYVKGRLEPLRSSFEEDDLNTWILRLLAQVPKIQENLVIDLLVKTYGGFLAMKQNPKWKQAMSARLEKSLASMKEHSLLEMEGDFISLSLLGKACSTSSLSFESVLRLIELFKSTNKAHLTPQNLLALIQTIPEMDNGAYTPMMKKGNGESQFTGVASDIYGHDIGVLLQKFARDNYSYYARCKRASIVWSWINGKSMEEIEDEHSLYQYYFRIEAGNIINIKDSTRFHLRSAAEICSLTLPGVATTGEDMDVLLKRLELGLPETHLPLLEISLPLSRGEYLALGKSGVLTLEAFKKLSKKQMKEIFNDKRMAKIEGKLDSIIS